MGLIGRKMFAVDGVKMPSNWILKVIAHAKPMRLGSVIEHGVDEEPSMFHSPLRDVITHVNAEPARDDIKAFIETIHTAAIPS